MRNSLTLLGLTTLIVVIGAIYAFSRKSTESINSPTSTSLSQESMSTTLVLTSPDFGSGGSIPSKFTCDGEQLNPALSVSGVPEGAKSLVLIMDDPDVPKQLRPDCIFDHWILFNLPALPSGQAGGRQVFLVERGKVPEGAVVGSNSTGKSTYIGPCPPREYEPSRHRYFFRLYVLDAMLPLETGATKAEVLKAMKGHVIGEAELMGTYKRP